MTKREIHKIEDILEKYEKKGLTPIYCMDWHLTLWNNATPLYDDDAYECEHCGKQRKLREYTEDNYICWECSLKSYNKGRGSAWWYDEDLLNHSEAWELHDEYEKEVKQRLGK